MILRFKFYNFLSASKSFSENEVIPGLLSITGPRDRLQLRMHMNSKRGRNHFLVGNHEVLCSVTVHFLLHIWVIISIIVIVTWNCVTALTMVLGINKELHFAEVMDLSFSFLLRKQEIIWPFSLCPHFYVDIMFIWK